MHCKNPAESWWRFSSSQTPVRETESLVTTASMYQKLIYRLVDLLAWGIEEEAVRALKRRAREHGRSAEAEHDAISTAAPLNSPRRKLADLLASMPDVGQDADFVRQPEGVDRAGSFG